MSSMLEQAIIDAEQLKETAKQTAEEGVVEKYQDEIKEAIEKILEQEETDDAAMTTNEEGSLDLVDDLPAAQMGNMEEVVEIDLNKLEEMMAQELEEGELDAKDMLERSEVVEELTKESDLDEEVELDESELTELADEEVDINEENLTSVIAEILGEDMIEDSTEEEEAEEKQSGVGVDDTKLEEVEELDEDKAEEEAQKGKRRDKDDGPGAGGGYKRGYKDKPMNKRPFQENLKKENNSLLREQKRSERKVQLLENKVNKYGTVIKKLETKLNESNLTNAKLLYQNRILNSVSLNERQKDKIVEAISNANSVEEAKLIFETLQSAVGVSKRKHKRPESLNEVVTRSSSAFIPRKEVKPSTDAFSERMKRLAGLK